MKIYYGISSQFKDVTSICFTKLLYGTICIIPSGDHERALLFTDPLVNVLKTIFIEIDNVITQYTYNKHIYINLLTNTVECVNMDEVINKLNNIHDTLVFNDDTIKHEYSEQKLSVKYITGNEKVLEIGANIGRNTLVIASLLNDQNNLVTLECCEPIALQLIENKNSNNYTFNVECAALSNRQLIQKGWNTMPSDVLLDGYNWVNTITLDNLKNKYNIEFDTLVLDCEGAFYYILMDMPEILNNIKLIIMENDYTDNNHKLYVDNVLKNNNFYRDYFEIGGWGPCYNNFYEVWKRF